MTAGPPHVPGATAARPHPLSAGEVSRRRKIRRTLTARAIGAGNTHSLKHGVYAEVSVRPEVLDEIAGTYARAPWLDPVRDGHLVEATCRIVVRLRKLDAVADSAAVKGLPALSSMYTRLEGQLTRNLTELGLTPRAAADLGLAKLDATARAIRLSEASLSRYRPIPRLVAAARPPTGPTSAAQAGSAEVAPEVDQVADS
ncbi:MAG: hypothetical protein ABSC46_13075 [Candidatus Limnocylindrales bacterium]|jgi:hypothetical protein